MNTISNLRLLKILGPLMLLFAAHPLVAAFESPQQSGKQERAVPDIFIHYVLYLDADVDAKALFAKHNQGELKLLESVDQGVNSPGVLLRKETIKERPLPPMESLPYFSRGFNAEVAKSFADSKSAISVIGLGPFDPKHDLLRKMTTTVGKMANDVDAFVFDVADSLTFTKEAFDGIRVAEIKNGQLSSNQFGIRAYRFDKGIRSVTMGLEKFGQTNITIANFAEHHMGVMDSFKGMVVQAVIESDSKVEPGTLKLEPSKFANAEQRARFEGLLRADFSDVEVEIAEAESQGGDPKELLGVAFKNKPGDALWEEQDKFLLTIFKQTRQMSEGVDMSDVQDAIEAARTRATEILKDKGQWAAPRRLKVAIGLPKQEVVWLEVTSFEKGAGKGILLSQPTKNPRLKSGQEIDFEPAMVMDFVLLDAQEKIATGGVDELIQKMNSGR